MDHHLHKASEGGPLHTPRQAFVATIENRGSDNGKEAKWKVEVITQQCEGVTVATTNWFNINKWEMEEERKSPTTTSNFIFILRVGVGVT